MHFFDSENMDAEDLVKLFEKKRNLKFQENRLKHNRQEKKIWNNKGSYMFRINESKNSIEQKLRFSYVARTPRLTPRQTPRSNKSSTPLPTINIIEEKIASKLPSPKTPKFETPIEKSSPTQIPRLKLSPLEKSSPSQIPRLKLTPSEPEGFKSSYPEIPKFNPKSQNLLYPPLNQTVKKSPRPRWTPRQINPWKPRLNLSPRQTLPRDIRVSITPRNVPRKTKLILKEFSEKQQSLEDLDDIFSGETLNPPRAMLLLKQRSRKLPPGFQPLDFSKLKK
eukprot:GHVP01049423.1.p1 GENE.GHVP01049423.1~~GHVP01049423.1.p1  ORF type:complete len:289 (+),score=55.15 GHVP01049423.1:32-868(+)